MRRYSSLAVVAVVALIVSAFTAPSAGSAGLNVVADWQMNEPPGSTLMVDSSGLGNHGAIDQDAATAGLELDGSDYQWSPRCRDCPPTALARVVQVPDSPALDIPDPTVPWSLEFRFKTYKKYGNLMQKGYFDTDGGQVKVEDPRALRCVFKGANGDYVTAHGSTPLDDGEWHTVACVKTATSVSQWVDGVLVATQIGETGPIDNAMPFVIGGKTECDQETVGCDYYRGRIDWARITHG